MKELVRIVEHQASLSSYRATQNEERAMQLELLIEMTKPKNLYLDWHPLIATPFRYNPPHPEARFRIPFGRNIFYGSCSDETALYEHAFHFMRERMHLPIATEVGVRTLFSVEADDRSAIDVKKDPNYTAIIDKNDYAASHQFIKMHPDTTFIVYPSCRDPRHRDNAAVLDINHFKKTLNNESAIKFFYNNAKQQITWLDYSLSVQWDVVG